MHIQPTSDPVITVVGHPFIGIGMGTHVRSVQRSLLAARVKSSLLNIYGYADDPGGHSYRDLHEHSVDQLSTPINIFCINADEIEPVLAHLRIADLGELGAYNIIYPMWELPKYPSPWAKLLSGFDEVWAPSLFVESALKANIETVHHLPIACEVTSPLRRSRSSFGIPEDPFIFLTSFDFSSYMTRKNPFAAIEAFKRTRELVPNENIALVIKVKNGEARSADYRLFNSTMSDLSTCITVIDEKVSNDEMLSLISLCDVYVSLHRSEGFGLGIAEAMCLGRPAVCTAWSGNMDFCDAETSQLVNYDLIPVKAGEYPAWQGQVWADVNIEDAAQKMVELLVDAALYRTKSLEGLIRIKRDFSYLATGLRYKRRIDEIQNAL